MPWNKSDWIKACNPVKLKEYLAVGRPIVSTDFDELRCYDGLVRIAGDSAGFADQLCQALTQRCDREALRRRVMQETWEHKYNAVLKHLAHCGLVPTHYRRSPNQGTAATNQ
jgi:hypothetical protein